MKQRFPFAATIVNVVIVVVVVMMMMMVAFVISPRVYRVRVLLLEIWGRWKAMTRLWVLVVVCFFVVILNVFVRSMCICARVFV